MSLTILIIDDEPYLPHQFARFLRKHGYEVYTVPDGESGLHELQRRTIDLVLLDVRLPKFSGLEVLTQMRKTRSEEHTSELQSPMYLVCRLLLEKKNQKLL